MNASYIEVKFNFTKSLNYVPFISISCVNVVLLNEMTVQL